MQYKPGIEPGTLGRESIVLSIELSEAHWMGRQLLLVSYQFIGPLLDDWLKGGTPKALKGLPSVITLVYVCLYVCLSVIKLQVTVFDPVS